jgi:hypothetical protein
MCDLTPNGGYVVATPSMQIREIELISCVVNRSPVLDKEPYIYIGIDQITGDYKIMSDSNKIQSVFGKLIPEKTVNEFIFYRAENCKKTFNPPLKVEQLTITLMQYDHTPISLNKLNVKDLSSSKTYYRINTRGPHYLSSGDSINISRKESNKITVESIIVIDTPTSDTLLTECPMKDIAAEDRCTFDRVQVKCSLTFRVKGLKL